MILNNEQAKACYDAMCSLNNVCGILHTRIFDTGGMTIHIQEYLNDKIDVWYGDRPGNPVGGAERYTNQEAFKTAYKL